MFICLWVFFIIVVFVFWGFVFVLFFICLIFVGFLWFLVFSLQWSVAVGVSTRIFWTFLKIRVALKKPDGLEAI